LPRNILALNIINNAALNARAASSAALRMVSRSYRHELKHRKNGGAWHQAAWRNHAVSNQQQ